METDEVTLSFNPVFFKDHLSFTRPEIVNSLMSLKEKFDHSLIKQAIEIYYELSHKVNTKSIKKSRKMCLIFYCLFMALDRSGMTTDPVHLAELVGLPRNKIERSFSEFSASGIYFISPMSLVTFYVERYNALLQGAGMMLKLNEAYVIKGVEEVIERCRESRAGREWMDNTSSKVVAIACIHFYLTEFKGLEIEKDTFFSEACYLSLPCIKRYHEFISKYYNMGKEEPVLNNFMYKKIKIHF